VGTVVDYHALDEDRRIAVLLREITSPRPLTSPHLAYLDETVKELAILRKAAEAHRLYGPAAVPHYVISKTDGASDVLEVAVLLKEVGLLYPREGRLDVDIVPLFETIADLQRCGRVMVTAAPDLIPGRHDDESKFFHCHSSRMIHAQLAPPPQRTSAGSSNRIPAGRRETKRHPRPP
jgi:hypothetical protein